MKLTEIDLQGNGNFLEEPSGFECKKFYLPASWDYIYTNDKILLRICHNGSGYLQLDPPGGPGIFSTERNTAVPQFFTWLIPHQNGKFGNAFTNFWLPNSPTFTGGEPDEYSCRFLPDSAQYHVRSNNWIMDTELIVPPNEAVMTMTITVTNAASQPRRCTLMPSLKPFMAHFMMAPWDVPHWYQTSAFYEVNGIPGFFMEIRDPGGEPIKRIRAGLITDLKVTSFETCMGRFNGHGFWQSPSAVLDGKCAQTIHQQMPPWDTFFPDNATVGQAIAACMAADIELGAEQSQQFTLVIGKLSSNKKGTMPPQSEMSALARFFDPQVRERAKQAIREKYQKLFAIRTLTTPDEALNQYTNTFLPMQLKWVMALDRGWPTGGRGTRDASQDTTGIIPLDQKFARQRLMEIISKQRSDGWFPRGYPIARRKNFKSPGHVDAGVWVWEFLHDFICYTRDFAFLDEKIDWMDSDTTSTVLDHMTRCFSYYLSPKNLGEHGLVKIYEGDWNDSVNRAGVEGRGETVMVSCQLVLALEQSANLLEYLGRARKNRALPALAKKYRSASVKLRRNILKHAFNKKGFFNAVFNDGGKWVFSDKDPDGEKRINNPANSFAIIAGIIPAAKADNVFNAINELKGPYGWRLLFPPTGIKKPIEHLGRTGHGDLAYGIAENGTPYNHGSHGFFARAAYSAGRGGLFYEIMRWMMPYYQDCHPVHVARTAPYGVVNHWKEAVGLEGVGGETFLSGSVTTALRNLYDGMLGFRPELEDLTIDPVIPADWKQMQGEVPFLGGRITIKISNPDGVECGVKELRLDGRKAGQSEFSERLGRPLASIPLTAIKAKKDHTIEVMMGTSEG